MKPYNDYSSYLRNKYGCKVYRIGLDAGFSCPNRDGTIGRAGCSYCNDDGSRSSYTNPAHSVQEQLKSRIEYLKAKKSACKFIAYFQAFTNTHAPVNRLKAAYDNALLFNEIVGISIGTRPDAVDKDKLSLVASYKKNLEVWLEYGLQSVNEKTLKSIKRGYTFDDFVTAFKMAKDLGIPVCAHVIIGLPGEKRDDIIGTAQSCSKLKIDGIKIHALHILKNSPMEKLYNEGAIQLLTQNEYVSLTCDFLEHLSPEIIIQRLTGQGGRESHIAPLWALDKISTINKIDEELKNRGSFQGSAICGCCP